MKQTSALEWLFEKLWEEPKDKLTWHSIFEKAKAMETKQIKCYCGHTTMCDCSPLEEPKQETLEETALRLYPRLINDPYNPMEDDNKEERDIWINGAKWQQEIMYSEEDMREAFKGGGKMSWTDINQETQEPYYYDFKEWFKQFKKK